MSSTYEPLEYTGERMVPEKAESDVYWEHIYRYRFAVPYVAGKRVLDIACGEGYGSAAFLKAGAVSVIGIDISEETCRHAREKYDVDARFGDAENIPLPDGSVDLVVSFETIEHVTHPAVFIAECFRILAPAGQIIISTPNKDVYRINGEQHNPYHCSEMTEDEFLRLMDGRFTGIGMFAQDFKFPATWLRERRAAVRAFCQRTRGLGRLTRIVQSQLEGGKHDTLQDRTGLGAVQQILTQHKSLLSKNSVYEVRKQQTGPEQATYIIAVARKRG